MATMPGLMSSKFAWGDLRNVVDPEYQGTACPVVMAYPPRKGVTSKILGAIIPSSSSVDIMMERSDESILGDTSTMSMAAMGYFRTSWSI
jgi:hypothetical protein